MLAFEEQNNILSLCSLYLFVLNVFGFFFSENVDELESEGVSNVNRTGTRLSKVNEGFCSAATYTDNQVLKFSPFSTDHLNENHISPNNINTSLNRQVMRKKKFIK